MATLTIWRFDTPDGARQAVRTLESLAASGLIKLHDAAIVSWAEGAKKPATKQLHNLAGRGALGGMFWGMLFGLIFFVPLLGAAIGAATGALVGVFSDVGIDDRLIARVREQVTPGTSALFLYSSDAVLDKIKEAMAGHDQPELLFTNLSNEQEEALRAAFAEEPDPPVK
ncbi:DUF1269 domain-containing protein [Kibdelosporangium philippinense]|uniref:DUF1269 domain-containing protein n=1 Tax=Kibdelosporangium philippinense TaxID=211113 RepID=A0ABS8Z2P8_9PSEU|nr:DUF1269 domain-containing protein [Kibdelosporangium philippinense]MCE7002213.1 DUF1269 domain-containing protein [Kibdelosporangium philippinense]